MNAIQVNQRPTTAKAGWGILLAMSALLTLAGIGWLFGLPDMALENIAQYASLQPEVFMQGEPSAFDIITMIARGYGLAYAILGVLTVFVAFSGYRHGARWAWSVMWVLVATFAALAASFALAGENVVLSGGIFAFALVALAGLLLARRDLQR